MKDYWDWIVTEGAYRNKKDCAYWGDGGAGVLPLAQNTGRLLVNHRSPYVNEGNTYGIFGGGIFLDETQFKSTDEMASTDYPKNHALQELKEETGYHGPMDMTEIYIYKDSKNNNQGEPCNFYYWNFAGICPVEFPVSPGSGHEWENGEGSRWVTITELMNISPQHFGLKSVLQNAGSKLSSMVKQLGFQGNEQYPAEAQTQPRQQQPQQQQGGAVVYSFTKRQAQPRGKAEKILTILKTAGLKPQIITQPDGSIMIRTYNVPPAVESQCDRIYG